MSAWTSGPTYELGRQVGHVMQDRRTFLVQKLVSVLTHTQYSLLRFEDSPGCQVHVGQFCYFPWDVIRYKAEAN